MAIELSKGEALLRETLNWAETRAPGQSCHLLPSDVRWLVELVAGANELVSWAEQFGGQLDERYGPADGPHDWPAEAKAWVAKLEAGPQ